MSRPQDGENLVRTLLRSIWLLIACTAVLAASARAEYIRLLLFELATQADVIASGQIVRVDADSYDLSLEDVVLGDALPRTLRIRKFEDWTCHQRWTSYAEGQRLLVFLERNPDAADSFLVMGAGDEGELPFVGDQVVAEHTAEFRVRGHEVAVHQVAGATMRGTLLSYAELAAAIRGFRAACPELLASGGAKPTGEARTEELGLLARTSAIARHMVDEYRSSRLWTGDPDAGATILEAGSLRCIWARRGVPDRVEVLPGGEVPQGRRKLESSFGAALAFLGDVDGDGFEDLAVGTPGDDELGSSCGAVSLLFLDGEGRVSRTSAIREQVTGTAANLNEGSLLGYSLAALGDLDGDGISELAVGAPTWSGVAQWQGGVWVLFLDGTGNVNRSVELVSSDRLRAAAAPSRTCLGASLAHLGDLDGDGTIELAIGQSPGTDLGDDRGRAVFIVSLTADGTVQQVRLIPGGARGLDSKFSRFGGALANIGDVDGNSVPDLAIADSNDSDGGPNRGAVWIALLTSGGELASKVKISDWSGGFEAVIRDNASFGSSLAGPGDLDGDGVPDLLVGSCEGVWALLLARDGSVHANSRSTIREPDRTNDLLCESLASSMKRNGAAAQRMALGSTRGEGGVVWLLQTNADGSLRAW